MAQLVYYSLALRQDEPRPDLVWQFEASVASLRSHNRDIAVALFHYGALPPELASVCRVHRVMVQDQGPYSDRLAALCPVGWPALARYPLLHKFLNFRELVAVGATQILYCDCDTIFIRDVAALFDRYAEPDLVAREEVHTSRSRYGADRSFVDESLLALLARSEGTSPIAPFNLGVVLFNNGIWRRLAPLEAAFVDYAWRFVTWMSQHPATGASAGYGEFKGAADAIDLVTPEELARALPFPSCNRWILDEASLWLTLGHVPGITQADFHPSDVAQNGEFASADPSLAGWILCHYYSQNMGRIGAWLRAEPALTPA